jgi:GTP-binding protein HflX
MFATLDPTSRRLRLPIEQEIIINDTVGFIRDLPEALVAAFRATLEEISDSDLLVHVVDAANPNCLAHIESVDKILQELKLKQIPHLIVLNKSDLLDEVSLQALKRQIELDKQLECVAISAIQPTTLKPLIEKIGEIIGQVVIDDLQFAIGK